MIVADVNGEIVAVAANERTEHPQQGSLADVRYLMVFAVRHDQRRGGTPRCWPNPSSLRCNAKGVPLRVHWLVYPTNLASIAFSRTVFPEADETYLPRTSRTPVSCSLSERHRRDRCAYLFVRRHIVSPRSHR